MNIEALSAEEAEVWAAELDYFRYLQTRDLNGYMTLWDERFVGWPHYKERPIHKQDIADYVAEQFQSARPALQVGGAPHPQSIVVLGDVAIAYYFWPEADDSSPMRYRITHTWRRGSDGWRIIGGMSCPMQRSK